MDIFINKKLWSTFDDNKLDIFKDSVFNYYREKGFPYFHLSGNEIKNIIIKMKDFDSNSILIEKDVLKQYMLGLNLVNYYMPHIWEIRSGNHRTPMETFLSDDYFRKVIDKRVRYGDNMSDSSIRKGLSLTNGSHRVSNFRPTIAKYIYDNYSGGGNVLDFSCGFGGRLLGAMSSNKVKKYFGVEPSTKTYNKLLELSKLSDLKVDIRKEGFEVSNFKEGSFDLSFSSPPYFDTEKYSDEDTQSYIKYPTKEKWRDGFLTELIQKNWYYLKKDGYFILNIANVKTYKEFEEDSLRISKQIGFKLIKTYKMQLSSLMKGGFKFEPIFVFQK